VPIFAKMNNSLSNWQDTIVAQATANAIGAIAIIRLSGAKSWEIANKLCPEKNFSSLPSHKAIFCKLSWKNELIDEVVITLYKGPKSYTGEDTVEISCHGSPYIVTILLQACVELGARIALPGEFTQRAFLNNKLDLSQAEAVADVIASENEAQHKIAMQQLRGGFSKELANMREQLINFAALVELELDFSEEDVEFADRTALKTLLVEIQNHLTKLAESFTYGNAIKKGIPVAIIGQPNAGKSTLLNALLNEDKAIVSAIAGTTRDVIEDILNIDGISFRFIDTAGIRNTTDEIESLGIAKTMQKAKEASIVLLLVDVNQPLNDIVAQYQTLDKQPNQSIIIVVNKIDAIGVCNGYDVEEAVATTTKNTAIAISAKDGLHIDKLKKLITDSTNINKVSTQGTIVANARHYQAINATLKNISDVQEGMQASLSGDLLSIDIRSALKNLGSITGQVEVDKDILGTIFGKFCIGK
jgi:tRNA modification GTPase